MSITFLGKDGSFLKQWPNVEYADHCVPNAGDHVILHWGDRNEKSEECVVLFRTFDGTRPDTLYCTVERLELD